MSTRRGMAGFVFDAVAGTGTGATTLNELTDVNITSPADNSVLAFDQDTGEWVDAILTVAANFNELLDVDTTGAVTNSIMKYDGTTWVVGTDATGSGDGSSTYNFVSVTTSYAMDGTEDYLYVDCRYPNIFVTLPAISTTNKTFKIDIGTAVKSTTIDTNIKYPVTVLRYMESTTAIIGCSDNNELYINGVSEYQYGHFQYVHTGATPIVGVTSGNTYLFKTYGGTGFEGTTYTVRESAVGVTGQTVITIGSATLPDGTHEVKFSKHRIGEEIYADLVYYSQCVVEFNSNGVDRWYSRSNMELLDYRNYLSSTSLYTGAFTSTTYVLGDTHFGQHLCLYAPLDEAYGTSFIGSGNCTTNRSEFALVQYQGQPALIKALTCFIGGTVSDALDLAVYTTQSTTEGFIRPVSKISETYTASGYYATKRFHMFPLLNPFVITPGYYFFGLHPHAANVTLNVFTGTGAKGTVFSTGAKCLAVVETVGWLPDDYAITQAFTNPARSPAMYVSRGAGFTL